MSEQPKAPRTADSVLDPLDPRLVRQVLTDLATGVSIGEIPSKHPDLTIQEVKAALDQAAKAVDRSADPPDQVSGQDEGQITCVSTPSQSVAELNLNKILVVDDLELNRMYIQTVFKKSDYDITMASSGQEALEKARAEMPFLVLSDIQMPQMDGFELCRRLKADEKTQNIAVFFVTAHKRGAQQVSKGLDMGADDFVFRPFERDELMARIRALARLKRAEEDARRQARTVVRRNKELELLNDLALAVNSSLDLQEIFASSMQRLSQLLDAEAVSLLMLNEGNQKLVVNVSSRTGERTSAQVDFRPREEIDPWVVQERVPSIVAEVLEAPDSDLDLEIRSISCLPMTSREQVVGAIAIINRHGGAFSPTDWVLLNSAAGIVAVALENARLLQNVQQQVTDLVLLNEIGHALTSTLDLDQILERTTKMVQESLRAEAASLWLLEEDSQQLVLTASFGPGAKRVIGFRMELGKGIAGHVAQSGQAYFSTDVSDDELFYRYVAEISDYPPKSMLCVPVQIKGQIIGVLQALHSKTRWFDQDDLRLLYSVAASVGIAVENAQLFGEVQAFNRELERMVAERTRELAEEKETTEAILASMADGLLVLDEKGRILTANTVAEGMLGFQLEAMQGQPVQQEHLENPLWRCVSRMASGDQLTASASVDVADPAQLGGMLSIQAHAARVRDDADQVIGTVIVLRDITAITQVERMKARFMAGVTHELKTPLSVIRLHSNNLKTYHDRLAPDKRRELLDAIQNQVELLAQLVQNILDLSRLDAGEVQGERQLVDLVDVVERAMADLRPLAQEKHISLGWDQKPSRAVNTLANPEQIDRVIRNLVDNGIKYTQAGGSVRVQLGPRGRETVEIRVSDTGMGIPSEEQTRVFERFYRVDSSHTVPGTGLGLAIVKEIVKAHGGEVHLESIEDQGTTFIVTLPGVERE